MVMKKYESEELNMGIFSNLFSKKEPPKPQTTPQEEKKPKAVIKTQRHILTDIEEHMEDIMELADKNEDYKLKKKDLIEDNRTDEKIYQYELSEKAQLFIRGGAEQGEEIQVFVHDIHIGNIKKNSISKVKKLLNSGNIQRIDTEVTGGHYKKLRYDGGRDKYFYDELEDAFSITIEITYREEMKE